MKNFKISFAPKTQRFSRIYLIIYKDLFFHLIKKGALKVISFLFCFVGHATWHAGS